MEIKQSKEAVRARQNESGDRGIEFYNTTYNEQQVIAISHHSTTNSMDIIRLYAPSDMYRKGLEANHRPIVSMGWVAGSIGTLLQYLLDTDNLTSVQYDRVIGAYEPFIDKAMKFEKVAEFAMRKENADDWM